jgi:hypothetical protein
MLAENVSVYIHHTRDLLNMLPTVARVIAKGVLYQDLESVQLAEGVSVRRCTSVEDGSGEHKTCG